MEVLYAVIGIVVLLLATVVFPIVLGERGFCLRRSTVRLVQIAGLRRLFTVDALHGYLYARWPRQYIAIFVKYLIPRMNQRQKQWLADGYHGKVLMPEHARAIVELQKPLEIRDLKEVLPYKRARQLVLECPPIFALFECPCRSIRETPCRPTQVCILVGKPVVEFALEHHPKKTRRASRKEVLEVLQAEHERGHVHMGWFKDVCLDRLFAICNCCKCCCGGIEAMTKYGVPMIAPSGFVAQVQVEACKACGTCAIACPFGAITLSAGKVSIATEKCMGCGICETRCPNEAIRLKSAGRQIEPLDVRFLA